MGRGGGEASTVGEGMTATLAQLLHFIFQRNDDSSPATGEGRGEHRRPARTYI
jgi:hypothetical protein